MLGCGSEQIKLWEIMAFKPGLEGFHAASFLIVRADTRTAHGLSCYSTALSNMIFLS